MKKGFYLNSLQLWILILLMFVQSYFFSVLASGGWSVLIILSYLGASYALIALLFLFLKIIFSKRRWREPLFISYSNFTLLLISFFLFIATTGSDCGDASGSYTYIFKLIDTISTGGYNLCGETSLNSLLLSLSFFAKLFHFLMILSLFRLEGRDSTQDKSYHTSFFKALLVVVLAFGLIYASLFKTMNQIVIKGSNQYNLVLSEQTNSAINYKTYPFGLFIDQHCAQQPNVPAYDALMLAEKNSLHKPDAGAWGLSYTPQKTFSYPNGNVLFICGWKISVWQQSTSSSGWIRTQTMSIDDETKNIEFSGSSNDPVYSNIPLKNIYNLK